VSLEDVVVRFCEHLRSRGFSARTVSAYAGAVRRFAAWLSRDGAFDPASVSALDVAEWKRSMQEAGRKPSTVNASLDALSAFFSWAVSRGLAPSDPAAGVKRVPESRVGPRSLDRKALASLLRVLGREGTPRDRALVALLVYAGLRVSEACSLRVSDVELRERSGLVRVRSGKGGRWREVPLNAAARRELSAYLREHRGGEWLFPGKGGSLTPRAAQKLVSWYGRLAGIPNLTPHVLRHTFCKQLVDAGESLDRVAVLAGHASLDATARYTRPSLSDLEKAVGRLDWE